MLLAHESTCTASLSKSCSSAGPPARATAQHSACVLQQSATAAEQLSARATAIRTAGSRAWHAMQEAEQREGKLQASEIMQTEQGKN